MQSKSSKVMLRGIRPIMFDRYAGDNSTELKPEEKMYLDEDGIVGIPILNLYSLLSAENTKSVAKLFGGKQWRDWALGINGFLSISATDGEGEQIPLLDDNGPIKFTGWNEKIYVRKDVARLAKGIPNPKTRPCINTPWKVEMKLDLMENKYVSSSLLQRMIEQGGILGLGTFRPVFGRYVIETWENI